VSGDGGHPHPIADAPAGDLTDLTRVDPDHYSLVDEVARGGMGRILHARDRRHGRPVAIKELLAHSPDRRARFRREALITARLQQPAIVPVMAPEQARGEPLDARTDVYALGAILYHVFAAVPPYQGESTEDVLTKVLAGPPRIPLRMRAPLAPKDLLTIVDKAMARDPDERYPTAAELAEDLKRFQTGQLVAAHEYSTWQLVGRWAKRHRALVLATLAILLVGAVGGTISMRQIVSARDRAE